MTTTPVPATYDEWKHCITILCGIPLTAEFVETRIAALQNPALYETQRFIATWGEKHRSLVIAWFERARRELDTAPEVR